MNKLGGGDGLGAKTKSFKKHILKILKLHYEKIFTLSTNKADDINTP